jgi:hypothetical protein
MKIFALFLFLLPALTNPASAAWPGSSSTCYFPDASRHIAPTWICQTSAPRGVLSAVGYARGSRAGFSFAREMAIADARVKLAQLIQGQCGRSGYSDAILRNSRVLNVQRSPSGGIYARVGVRAADLSRGC